MTETPETVPQPYATVSENPGGSHARESTVPNVWVVTCQNCGAYDMVGPGHPAVRDRGDGTHELHDRAAVRHDHADGCEPHPETGNYPLDFSFMTAPAALRPRKLGIIGTQLLMLRAFSMYRLAMLAAGMTDQTLVNALLSNIWRATAAGTWAPTGGTSITITPPLKLRLFQVTGTEAATGTEQTGTNGYTTGGSTMGAPAGAVLSAGATSNVNQVQWTASGTWANATNGIEIWDTSATPVRIHWGALTLAIAANAVVSADTVTFAVGALTASGVLW
jgi:hypothetical protein